MNISYFLSKTNKFLNITGESIPLIMDASSGYKRIKSYFNKKDNKSTNNTKNINIKKQVKKPVISDNNPKFFI